MLRCSKYRLSGREGRDVCQVAILREIRASKYAWGNMHDAHSSLPVEVRRVRGWRSRFDFEGRPLQHKISEGWACFIRSTCPYRVFARVPTLELGPRRRRGEIRLGPSLREDHPSRSGSMPQSRFRWRFELGRLYCKPLSGVTLRRASISPQTTAGACACGPLSHRRSRQHAVHPS